MLIRPKDYVETKEGLLFAVVSDRIEDDRVLTFLRYRTLGEKRIKCGTTEASEIVRNHYPEYLFHSQHADIELHGIPIDKISSVYRPEQTVERLLKLSSPDKTQQDAINMITLLIGSRINKEVIGVTGSIMLNTHNDQSDIDMVVYGRENFFKVRQLIKAKIEKGDLAALTETHWQDAWQRRDCELGFDEYCYHEQRKYNKCLSGNSKVDISMILNQEEKIEEHGYYKKLGYEKMIVSVIDDTFSYDFPARYRIDNDEIKEVVCHTATYTGQAQQGERVEVVGYVEQDKSGNKRLVVGTSREAAGEYIKVIK